MLKMVMSPVQRRAFLRQVFDLQGLRDVSESPHHAYGIISLTGLGKNVSPANERVKAILGSRQAILRRCLESCGVNFYDPASAPLSPDLNLTSTPQDVFRVDMKQVATAQFVTMSDVVPTTGGGIEESFASLCGKFTVIVHDPNIRTSRMQVHRAVHLMTDRLGLASEDLTETFRFLQQFEPCFAEEDGHPVMAGVHRMTGQLVNLEAAVYNMLPQNFRYVFDGNVPIVLSAIMNPDIFAEYNGVRLTAHRLTGRGSLAEVDEDFHEGGRGLTLVVSSIPDSPDVVAGGVADAVLLDHETGRPMTSFNPFPNPGRRGVAEAGVLETAMSYMRRAGLGDVDVAPVSVSPAGAFNYRAGYDGNVIPFVVNNGTGQPVAVLEFNADSGANVSHYRHERLTNAWEDLPTARSQRFGHVRALA